MKRRCWLLAAGGMTLLVGCATTPRPDTIQPALGRHNHWQGRFALRVDDGQDQAFYAPFELHGNMQEAWLRLYSPIGTVLAELRWGPGGAQLNRDGRIETYDSPESMSEALLGTRIPFAAWFDWLDGIPTEAPGWAVDLADYPMGRLHAVRTDPQPSVDLRIILEDARSS
jgi:outer membrane lipoprotein LolB